MQTDECLTTGLVFDIFGCKRSDKAGIYSTYDIQHLFAVHLVTLPFGLPDYETLHIAMTRHLKLFMRAQLWTAVPGVQRRMVSVLCKENKVEKKKLLFKLC